MSRIEPAQSIQKLTPDLKMLTTLAVEIFQMRSNYFEI